MRRLVHPWMITFLINSVCEFVCSIHHCIYHQLRRERKQKVLTSLLCADLDDQLMKVENIEGLEGGKGVEG